MKSLSRCLVVSVVILSASALASVALARGAHHGGVGGRGMGGNLCTSSALLNLSLSNIDILIKTSGNQTAALEELKKVAKENYENMSRVCAGDSPISVPAKLEAAEKRLGASLMGTRKLRPVAEKFYATLNDEQKTQANSLMDWPGL